MEGEICSSSLRKKLTASRLRPSTPCTKYVSTMAAVSGDVRRSAVTAPATVSPAVAVAVTPAAPSRSSSSSASRKAPRAQRREREGGGDACCCNREASGGSVRRRGEWKRWEVDTMRVDSVVGRAPAAQAQAADSATCARVTCSERLRRGNTRTRGGVTDLW